MHEAEQPRNPEYLNKRLADLNISEGQNTFIRKWTQTSSRIDDDTKEIIIEDHRNEREYKIFDCDEYGNIVIRYFNLDGQPYRWKKEGTSMSRDFKRKRLRELKGDKKYDQEPGSPQLPFFNPELIAKYKRAKHPELFPATEAPGDGQAPASVEDGTIDTLFLVEGEFKARAGQLAGIDIIGLPSIHGFYNGDVKGKLNEDIQELIIICRVKKIVFLIDADLLSVKWAEDKDLATRPQSFFGAIKSFRESLQLLLDDNKIPLELVYFMHINSKFMNDAKGLDDLLSKYTAKHDEIIQDLYSFQFAKKYFSGKIINDLNKDVLGTVYRYLGLTDETEFYKTYGEDFIGAKEFKFKRRRYIYNQEEKEVKFVRHEDAARFMRIGPDWVKVVQKKNQIGQVEQVIVPWKITEIQRDYKRYPDFIEQIQRYDAFCNEPACNGSYLRSVNNCYNLFEPLTWKAEEGPIGETLKFLKHLFQGHGTIDTPDGFLPKENLIAGDSFSVAMDWLTILVQNPKQPLPVPILVSPENNTGKSTFLLWLQILFGTNAVVLNNEQFKMKFNSHYITKFIIGIDESFLDVDKKSEKERLKQLVTARQVYMENKGQNVQRVDYYGKVVLCSNDADRVMKIDDGESRWFVNRVPVIQKKDPDLEKKLMAEMPAWLHYVQNRTVFHPREDRLWFKAESFITEQFRIIVETTKNRMDRVFEDWIREQFTLYRLSTLRYSMSHLAEAMNDSKNNKYKVDKIELRAYLQARNVEYDKRPQRFKVPKGLDIPEGDPGREIRVMMEDCNPTTPYIFRIEQWLSVEDVEKLMPLTDPHTLIMKPIGQGKQAEMGFSQPWDHAKPTEGDPF